MLRYFEVLYLLLGALCVSGTFSLQSGPRYRPTKGRVWPKPQLELTNNTYYIFDPSSFQMKVTGPTCFILTKAVARYSSLIEKQFNVNSGKTSASRRRSKYGVYKSNDPYFMGTLKDLEISLDSPCEDYPHLGMEESYSLGVSSTPKLFSSSIWGALRGLETFAQLFYIFDDRNEVRINLTEIYDRPRYRHRGLLLDTTRHIITLKNILTTLDAMAINKMNVFHWRMAYDQSFPYLSESDKSVSMVYTKGDVDRLIDYAKDRGIRVIPEFNIYEQSSSWNNTNGSTLTECYQDGQVVGTGPVDPTKIATYKLLCDFFKELQALFPDKYFHVGGRAADTDCWRSNPDLIEYMRANHIDASGLHAQLTSAAISMLANDTNPILWQELFEMGLPLSEDAVVQVWKRNGNTSMVDVLNAGHRVLFSSSWHLDELSEWQDYYAADPRQLVLNVTSNETLLAAIVGGEAYMWADAVDDGNVINGVWPRASAVAERLWSYTDADNPLGSSIPREVFTRFKRHACRMTRRGIDVQLPFECCYG